MIVSLISSFFSYLAKLAALTIVVLLILGALTAAFRGVDELGAFQTEAQLKQLRSDYATLKNNKAVEDVLGQVVAINQKIATKQKLKSMDYIELCFSDKWLLMEKITINP